MCGQVHNKEVELLVQDLNEYISFLEGKLEDQENKIKKYLDIFKPIKALYGQMLKEKYSAKKLQNAQMIVGYCVFWNKRAFTAIEYAVKKLGKIK